MRLFAICFALLAIVGCGTPEPDSYTEGARNDFLTACADPVGDGLVHIKLCQCTFDKLQESVVYARYVEIESLLINNPNAPLPDEVAKVLADCIIDEVEL